MPALLRQVLVGRLTILPERVSFLAKLPARWVSTCYCSSCRDDRDRSPAVPGAGSDRRRAVPSDRVAETSAMPFGDFRQSAPRLRPAPAAAAAGESTAPVASFNCLGEVRDVRHQRRRGSTQSPATLEWCRVAATPVRLAAACERLSATCPELFGDAQARCRRCPAARRNQPGRRGGGVRFPSGARGRPRSRAAGRVRRRAARR